MGATVATGGEPLPRPRPSRGRPGGREFTTSLVLVGFRLVERRPTVRAW
jgi:hypothetical protein